MSNKSPINVIIDNINDSYRALYEGSVDFKDHGFDREIFIGDPIEMAAGTLKLISLSFDSIEQSTITNTSEKYRMSGKNIRTGIQYRPRITMMYGRANKDYSHKDHAVASNQLYEWFIRDIERLASARAVDAADKRKFTKAKMFFDKPEFTPIVFGVKKVVIAQEINFVWSSSFSIVFNRDVSFDTLRR